MRHQPDFSTFWLETSMQIGCNSITQVSKFLEIKVASTSSRSSCESISHDLDAPRSAALCHSERRWLFGDTKEWGRRWTADLMPFWRSREGRRGRRKILLIAAMNSNALQSLNVFFLCVFFSCPLPVSMQQRRLLYKHSSNVFSLLRAFFLGKHEGKQEKNKHSFYPSGERMSHIGLDWIYV